MHCINQFVYPVNPLLILNSLFWIYLTAFGYILIAYLLGMYIFLLDCGIYITIALILSIIRHLRLKY